MSEGLNRVTLIGNLGADPELRYTQRDRAVLKMRVATSSSYFDEAQNKRIELTEWHTVVVWGKRGEGLSKILRKGGRLCIEGALKTRKWRDEHHDVDKYSTEVVATNIVLLGDAKRHADGPTGALPPDDGRGDDDIPF